MNGESRKGLWLFSLGLSLAVVAIYWIGLANGLVFDDERLRDGTVFGSYGHLTELKARLISYGSFVWVQSLVGEGWWKQRVVNIALHLCTVMAIYRLLHLLLDRTEFPANDRTAAHFEASRTLALRIGVALFALNPVAVYAVAYLIQRSILMAAMFVAVGCATFVQGLVTRNRLWIGLSVVCYLLAVLSKEHAVTAIALAVPLYVFVQRPSLRKVAAMSGAAVLLLLVTAAPLYRHFGALIGAAFDDTSRAYVLELERLSPGVSGQLYLLSIVNQATRFFQYGLLWFIPDVTRMSIDIRPEFPLSWWGWPHTAAALGYVAVLGGSAWLLSRRSDALGLAGLCIHIPALLFVTEFATVWVQDPFVLYRSYLWALTMPALVALLLVGLKPNILLALGAILVCLFAGLTFERLLSLRDARAAWADAAEKIDMTARRNAVGRWRPLLNLGAEYLDKGSNETAYRLFSQAAALGEPRGSAHFNAGVSLQQMNQHLRALDEFDKAEAQGFADAALDYHRGESHYAMGRLAEAFARFGAALARPQDILAEQHTRLRRAEAAIAINDPDTAIAEYGLLVERQPDNARYLVGLSMAYIGKRDFAAATAILDPLLAKAPSSPAYFARALARYLTGDVTASREDLGRALRDEPGNPQYGALLKRLDAERGAGAVKLPK